MTTSPSSTRRKLGPRLMACTAAAAMAMAIYHVATPAPDATYGSFSDWLRELTFLAYLLLTVAGVRSAHRAGQATRAVAVLITVGYGVIAAGVVAGLVMQEDPSWFFILGGPGNLLAAAGFVVWAIQGWRRRVFPAWAALLCGVGGLSAVFLAEFGTSVLIGAFWIYLSTENARASTQPAVGN